MSRITVNGIPLLSGQSKAVEIAAAKLETSLAAQPVMGDADAALLKLIREVRELIQCGQ